MWVRRVTLYLLDVTERVWMWLKGSHTWGRSPEAFEAWGYCSRFKILFYFGGTRNAIWRCSMVWERKGLGLLPWEPHGHQDSLYKRGIDRQTARKKFKWYAKDVKNIWIKQWQPQSLEAILCPHSTLTETLWFPFIPIGNISFIYYGILKKTQVGKELKRVTEVAFYSFVLWDWQRYTMGKKKNRNSF